MRQNMTTVLYVLLMVIVIVGLDLVFFRDLFWERLLSNVGVFHDHATVRRAPPSLRSRPFLTEAPRGGVAEAARQ